MRLRFLVLLLVLPLSGCMSMLHDSHSERVRINTNPTGATVSIEGREVGQTPLMVRLKTRDAGYPMLITRPNCKPVDGHIVAEFNGPRVGRAWMFAILFTGPFEMISTFEDGIFRNLADQSIQLQCRRS